VTVSNFTVCVNTLQITGQVELQGFVGTGTSPLHSRGVTFVATQVTPLATNILKTWTLTLTNLSGAVFDYALMDVPPATTHVSAKTVWNVRRKLVVAYSGPNGTAGFTGSSSLLGGDFDGSNRVSSTDNAILKAKWLQFDSVADVDGSGRVTSTDNAILKVNWLTLGDSE
jgi:hypothetical protein